MNQPNEALINKIADAVMEWGHTPPSLEKPTLPTVIREAIARQPNHPVIPAIFGVGRDAENPRALIVSFRTAPTDDELRGFHELLRNCVPVVTAEVVPPMSAELRGALLWLLWHHQGGSSPVGQPIRAMLGISQHASLTVEQVAEAKAHAEGRIYAQSEGARMPVMGEPVAWVIYTKIGKEWKAHPRLFSSKEEAQESIIHFHDQENTEIRPLFLRPSSSVTQEEMDALRRDARRYRWLENECDNVIGNKLEICERWRPSGERADTWEPVLGQLSVVIDRSMQEGK